MKKKLALFLAIALLGISITACSSNQPVTNNDSEGVNDNASNSEVNYPTKPIQLICVTKAGGATDAAARLVAQYMQGKLGQPVVVVNQDGGGGSVGAETVRNAEPDGYTILFHHTLLQCNYHGGTYAYSYKDFRPIATMPHVSQTISVRADAPWNTLEELVQDAKQNPNKYIFGVQYGGVSQFIAGILMNEAGVEFKMVDSGGEAEKLASLQGGHLDLIQATVGAASQYVEANKVKVLAVASEERDILAPDFPTAVEQGYNVILPTMHAMYAPKGLPDEIAKKINGLFAEMEADKDFMDKLNNIGQSYKYRDLEETEAYLEAEFNSIEAVAENLGLKK